ncbi:MAG: hypothetical protein ABSE77_21340 [Acidimicrobiales bacterium]|jgi:hypothetical protein
MGRKVDVEMLVSSSEVCRLVGASDSSHLSYWARAAGFPKPVARLGRSGQIQLWYWPDVAHWAYRAERVADGAWLVAPWRILERVEAELERLSNGGSAQVAPDEGADQGRAGRSLSA